MVSTASQLDIQLFDKRSGEGLGEIVVDAEPLHMTLVQEAVTPDTGMD